MKAVGIRELKQNASEVVARAEHGETISITVQGRPVAVLGPIDITRPKQWVSAAELAGALAALDADSTNWLEEVNRSRANDPLVDPWGSDHG